MYKKLCRVSFLCLLACGFNVVNAASSVTKSNTQVATAKQQVVPSDTVNLYAAPNDNANVVAQVDRLQRLIPFYHQSGWVKVGNPANGDVGWLKQQPQAMRVAVRAFPQVKTTIITTETDKNGKPVYHVYQSGDAKPLTQAQAASVAHRLQMQQRAMTAHMRHMMARMNNMWGYDPFWDDSFYLGYDPFVSKAIPEKPATTHNQQTSAAVSQDKNKPTNKS